MSALATTRPRHVVRPPPGMLGIRLELEPIDPSERRAFDALPTLCGAFRVAHKTPNLARPHHRSVVLVLQRGLASHVIAPFEELALLADDEADTPHGVEGVFGIDLRVAVDGSALRVHPDPRLLVFAVMGTMASNVLELNLSGR